MKFIDSMLLVGFSVTELCAWGSVGHKTVADIAELNLTSKARSAILSSLHLPTSVSIDSVALWADVIKGSNKTGSWHYIDYDVRASVTSADQFTTWGFGDSNVISQIDHEISVLKSSPNSAESEAKLKYLIHFLGDVHCPMHAVNDDDKGGNLKSVKLSANSKTTNLHALWDGLIQVPQTDTPSVLAAKINQEIPKDSIRMWQSGSAKDWAFQCFKMARDSIYPDFPQVGATISTVTLGANYYQRMRPLAELQVARAGIRLAWILNSIYDPITPVIQTEKSTERNKVKFTTSSAGVSICLPESGIISLYTLSGRKIEEIESEGVAQTVTIGSSMAGLFVLSVRLNGIIETYKIAIPN